MRICILPDPKRMTMRIPFKREIPQLVVSYFTQVPPHLPVAILAALPVF